MSNTDHLQLESLGKENRRLERKLARSEQNRAQMEDLQATNSRLLQSVMDELQAEKKKSEALLLNILPKQVVARLNNGETLIADRFDDVTVLFADFVGFTKISAGMPAARLVENLGNVFSQFDSLAQDLGVEKLKTIGDAYMAAVGLPEWRPDHVKAAAEMALGIFKVLERINPSLETPWQIRIGVHTGPVVAGIIGTHKFAYDVWGDTVNLASRLESSCKPGHIHVSEVTAHFLNRDFHLERAGFVGITGMGKLETYFLKGRRGQSQRFPPQSM